ncbi:MAG: aminotransferase class I/II-fold pyridoxal phosphate-dependent enzyme [Chloroflexi bacterium]|nr:aminotransferase class I/II-fold pyridoxal phosphate-dependent enzyme [Chloroflexota bacterium]
MAKQKHIPFPISQRLQRVPPYPFVVVAQKVRELQAQGVDVIRMDIGAPDMPPPPRVIDALAEMARRPDVHRYPGYRGSPELKEAFAAYYERRFHVHLDPEEEVLPLLGSKEGLHHITQAFVDPGDVVLVPDPGYLTYSTATLLAGGEIYPLPLREERGFLPDLNAVPPDVARKAKILWLNYPNNPTGAVADLAFFEQAVAFARQWNILLCHDAPYTDVTFGDYKAPSILQIPGAKEVAVEFNSLSKAFNMAGWRVGVALGNAEALAALLRMKSNVDSGIFLPIQHAAAVALREVEDAWIVARNREYARRRDIILETLPDLGMSAQPPQGSLYVWARVPRGMTGEAFAERALTRAGVSLAPGGWYGEQGKPFVRISLGVPTPRVKEAMERLRRLADESALID